jgi:nitrite reductase/ring-hydroxylating ferredoxin subunit
MTQEEIKTKRDRLKEELADARMFVDEIRGKLEALRNRCTHPNKFNTSFMGDSGVKCPDCGYAI